MKKILIFSIFCLVALTSCKKDTEVKPLRTNTETIMGGGTDKKLVPWD